MTTPLKPDAGFFLVVDKPVGPTARQLLLKIEQQLGCRGLGHTGTLDPLASGLMLVLGGQAKKLQHLLTGCDKTYQACFCLGARSATDDAQGPLEPCVVPSAPSRQAVEQALDNFRGQIWQRPPAFSAIRKGKRRLHQLARQGQAVQVAARKVHIKKLTLTEYYYPYLEVLVECQAGTYIRSLARDLGAQLGTGAYVHRLRRIALGAFQIEDAVTLEELGPQHCQPLEVLVARYGRIDLAPQDLTALVCGQSLPYKHAALPPPPIFAWINGRVVAWIKPQPNNMIRTSKLLYQPHD